MMTFSDFRRAWLSALEYTPEQHDLYVAEYAWQNWMGKPGDGDTDTIARVLHAIFIMAHGGVAAIRSVTGMSQVIFSVVYGIPRRSIQNWEYDAGEVGNAREAPDYTQILLGYAVLTDQLARITAAKEN